MKSKFEAFFLMSLAEGLATEPEDKTEVRCVPNTLSRLRMGLVFADPAFEDVFWLLLVGILPLSVTTLLVAILVATQ